MASAVFLLLVAADGTLRAAVFLLLVLAATSASSVAATSFKVCLESAVFVTETAVSFSPGAALPAAGLRGASAGVDLVEVVLMSPSVASLAGLVLAAEVGLARVMAGVCLAGVDCVLL